MKSSIMAIYQQLVNAKKRGEKKFAVLIDPDKPWIVQSAKMEAQAGNTPFDGQPVQGRVTAVFKGGIPIGS